MRAHISEIFGARGFAGIWHKRDRPNASECVRRHPNTSRQARTGPNTLPNPRKLRKTCENLRKLRENLRKLRENFAIVACVPSLFYMTHYAAFADHAARDHAFTRASEFRTRTKFVRVRNSGGKARVTEIPEGGFAPPDPPHDNISKNLPFRANFLK